MCNKYRGEGDENVQPRRMKRMNVDDRWVARRIIIKFNYVVHGNVTHVEMYVRF